ncbi:hypothetical protein TrRE_jg860, partial [Triparma retinervis]
MVRSSTQIIKRVLGMVAKDMRKDYLWSALVEGRGAGEGGGEEGVLELCGVCRVFNVVREFDQRLGHLLRILYGMKLERGGGSNSLASYLHIQHVVGDRFGVIHCDPCHCIFMVLRGGEGVFCMEKMRERDWDYRLEGKEEEGGFRGEGNELVGGVLESHIVQPTLKHQKVDEAHTETQAKSKPQAEVATISLNLDKVKVSTSAGGKADKNKTEGSGSGDGSGDGADKAAPAAPSDTPQTELSKKKLAQKEYWKKKKEQMKLKKQQDRERRAAEVAAAVAAGEPIPPHSLEEKKKKKTKQPKAAEGAKQPPTTSSTSSAANDETDNFVEVPGTAAPGGSTKAAAKKSKKQPPSASTSASASASASAPLPSVGNPSQEKGKGNLKADLLNPNCTRYDPLKAHELFGTPMPTQAEIARATNKRLQQSNPTKAAKVQGAEKEEGGKEEGGRKGEGGTTQPSTSQTAAGAAGGNNAAKEGKGEGGKKKEKDDKKGREEEKDKKKLEKFQKWKEMKAQKIADKKAGKSSTKPSNAPQPNAKLSPSPTKQHSNSNLHAPPPSQQHHQQPNYKQHTMQQSGANSAILRQSVAPQGQRTMAVYQGSNRIDYQQPSYSYGKDSFGGSPTLTGATPVLMKADAHGNLSEVSILPGGKIVSKAPLVLGPLGAQEGPPPSGIYNAGPPNHAPPTRQKAPPTLAQAKGG